MAIGKSSIKRAIASSKPEAKTAEKTAAVKAEPAKSGTAGAVKKGAVKKNAVKKSVITGTNEQVLTTVSQSEGINAHYGLNTPLPTFLL